VNRHIWIFWLCWSPPPVVDVAGRSELTALVGHELLMGRVSITTQCIGFYTSSVAHSDVRLWSIIGSLRTDAQRGEKPLTVTLEPA
jgi:hypothetical protein